MDFGFSKNTSRHIVMLMASKNTIRQFDTDAYYHIYNRGVEKRSIFQDDTDYVYFLHLLERHLGNEVQKDRKGRLYIQYESLELLAFCLMPNHFHLFMYQKDDPAEFTRLLRSVCTAYTMYFNRKYERVGHLFQDRFKAVRIDSDEYLQHISRYIHLNPPKPFEYKWSSLNYYVGNKRAEWIRPDRVLEIFKDRDDYMQFVQDYEEQKIFLDEIKHSLADL